MNTETNYKIDNVIKDPNDNRDYVLQLPKEIDFSNMPSKVFLESSLGRILNQGNIGSCVSNTFVNAIETLVDKTKELGKLNKEEIEKLDKEYSRLFHYYTMREMSGRLGKSGDYLRNGAKVLSKVGICGKTCWDYNTAKENEKPKEECYEEAKNYSDVKYERIPYLNDGIDKQWFGIETIKQCLYLGYPVPISMIVTEKLFSMKHKLEEQHYLGTEDSSHKNTYGHAMLIVGYDDNLNGFILENSWGKDWGDNGLWLLKYDVFLKDKLDAWVITKFNEASIIDSLNFDTKENLKIENLKDADNILFGKYLEVNYENDGDIVTIKLPEIKNGTPPYNVKFKKAFFWESGSEIMEVGEDWCKVKVYKETNDIFDNTIKVIVTDNSFPVKFYSFLTKFVKQKKKDNRTEDNKDNKVKDTKNTDKKIKDDKKDSTDKQKSNKTNKLAFIIGVVIIVLLIMTTI